MRDGATNRCSAIRLAVLCPVVVLLASGCAPSLSSVGGKSLTNTNEATVRVTFEVRCPECRVRYSVTEQQSERVRVREVWRKGVFARRGDVVSLLVKVPEAVVLRRATGTVRVSGQVVGTDTIDEEDSRRALSVTHRIRQ